MKFHKRLNEKLWDWSQEKRIGGKTHYYLKNEVADKLKEIANAFIEFLEIPKDAIKDIVITGSSASFNYTPQSDLDLHLKVDYDKVHEDCPLVEGYLWALKTQFNQDHDISIYGIPVEVYAESTDGDTVHNGLYSLQQGKWIDEPKPIAPTDNDSAVQAKFEEIKEAADRVEDSEVAGKLLEKIYKMRKSGLNKFGEFGTENLAFKKLRDAGVMDKLRYMKKEKIDKQLSLESYKENKMDECNIINNFKEMVNKIVKEFKEEGYPKSKKFLLDFVADAVKSFLATNKDYKINISTDNGTAVLILVDTNEQEDSCIYQARINAQRKTVKFTDLENSNYAYESLKASNTEKIKESISDVNSKLQQFIENSNPDCSLISAVHKALCEELDKTQTYKFTINKVADDKLELTSGESTFDVFIYPDDDLQDIQYAIEDFVDEELAADEDDSENITGTEVVGFKYDLESGKGEFEANIYWQED